ncbi:MAG: septum site-determining protein MinC [Desulfobacterales bacterium]
MDSNDDLPVRLKGVGDSLWVTIDPTQPVERLQAALIKPFERLKHLAVNARVIIDSGNSTDSDQLIRDLGEFLKERFQVGQVSKPPEKKKTVNKERIRNQDLGNAWHHYRSEALMIAGRVRSGQKIVAKKHLIIMGDLNPGAEVVAGGDILVMGTLSGKAQAGQPDNEDAIVMALQFRPTQIQIGGIVAAGLDSGGRDNPEFAYIDDQAIVVDDYLSNNPFKQLTWPEVR